MKKGLFALLLAAVLLFSLAACGGGTASQAPAPGGSSTAAPAGGDEPAAAGEISGLVRVAYAGAVVEDSVDEITGEPRRGYLTVINEAFVSKFPEVTVEFTTVPWTDYETKLQTMLMSNSVDVLGSGGSENKFNNAGLVMALDELIANDPDFDPETLYVGSAWEGCVFNTDVDGNRYGLPAAMGKRMPIYDKKIFDDWGVEYLSEHPTPEEVLEKAAQMTGINPVTGEQNYGLWFEGNNLANSLYTTLGIYYGEPGFTGERGDYKNLTFSFNSEGGVKIFEFYEEACKYVSPAVAANEGKENFGLETNNTAIYLEMNGNVVMSNYRLSGNTDTSMIERFIPTLNFGPNGEGWVACDNIIIAANAQNVPASWEMCKFLAGYEMAELYYTDYNGVPALSTQAADFLDPNDTYTATALEIANFGSVNSHDYVPELNSLELTPFVAAYVSDCINGQNATPQAAADDLQARAEKWQSELA